MKLNIAMLQLASHGLDQKANLNKGLEACRSAKKQGADLALFPEMWSIGYHIQGPQEEWQDQAITQDSAFFQAHQHLAKELGLAIALTYLETWPDKPRNTCAIIDAKGEVTLTYAKTHTCSFSHEKNLTPGDDLPVAKLEFPQGRVNLGALICFDREFPEPARVLALKGAEIILVPNACEMEANRINQLQARSFENKVGTVLTNYAAPQENGCSIAFDGVAFREDGTSRDHTLIKANDGEGVFLAEFDLRKMRKYRKSEPWGAGPYRHPELYKEITKF